MAQGIAMTGGDYGIHRTTQLPYEKAIEAATEELKTEGFGVLTEIDVRATLQKKIGADFPRYIILGACNPALANQALRADPDIGLLLPCNVVVAEGPDGATQVSALNPRVLFDRLVRSPEVHALACDVEARLTRALDAVAKR